MDKQRIVFLATTIFLVVVVAVVGFMAMGDYAIVVMKNGGEDVLDSVESSSGSSSGFEAGSDVGSDTTSGRGEENGVVDSSNITSTSSGQAGGSDDKIYNVELDFGVGNGIQWESGIFAPFADVGLWVTDPTYSNSGTLNLRQIMDETGVRYFNLGFINAVDSRITDGVLNWGFAGFDVLSEKHSDNSQYMGIKKSIKEVRDGGGDVTISVGGLNEGNFFQKTDDVDVLANTYLEIIDGFGLTRIDLDIEGTAQGYDNNVANATAIKRVQEQTGVEVVLTLPVLPSGLTSDLGLPTLMAYLDCGVDIVAVNIMTMCYGSYWSDYAQGTVDAIDATAEQIVKAYSDIGVSLTSQQAYGKVGITTSVGFEGEAHPIFTVEQSDFVVEYGKSVGINFVSFWSINRDSQTVENQGIYSKYGHTSVYMDFEGESSGARFLGAGNKNIEVGDDFSAVDGVTVRVDGVDLSSAITVAGAVDSQMVGSYTIVYSVVDGQGVSYSHQRIITVEVAEIPSTWSRDDEAAGKYTPGVKVLHNGIVYRQVSGDTVWWCEPGTDGNVWEKVSGELLVTVDYDNMKEWSREEEEKGVYTPNSIVSHNGVIYQQVSSDTAWWCEPGTDSGVWREYE